jgi:hypothetical protein
MVYKYSLNEGCGKGGNGNNMTLPYMMGFGFHEGEAHEEGGREGGREGRKEGRKERRKEARKCKLT